MSAAVNSLLRALAKGGVELAVPHTGGGWERTKPVGIPLAKNRKVLRFTPQPRGYD